MLNVCPDLEDTQEMPPPFFPGEWECRRYRLRLWLLMEIPSPEASGTKALSHCQPWHLSEKLVGIKACVLWTSKYPNPQSCLEKFWDQLPSQKDSAFPQEGFPNYSSTRESFLPSETVALVDTLCSPWKALTLHVWMTQPCNSSENSCMSGITCFILSL